jgi:hypothetical protein
MRPWNVFRDPHRLVAMDGTRTWVTVPPWWKEFQMSSERRQILDMLAGGKITAEDAERLLEKLGHAAREPRDGNEVEPGEQPVNSAHPKYFRIKVNSVKGDTVNIRIPLAFVRAGVKLSTVMPESARRRIEEKGIDLSRLSDLKGEELVDALRELTMEVNSADGDVVRMCCE